MKQLEHLFALLVVAVNHNYSRQHCNAFLTPLPKRKHNQPFVNRNNGQRKYYLAVTAEGGTSPEQPKAEAGKNQRKRPTTTKKRNYTKNNEITQEIRNCRNLDELLDLQRTGDKAHIYISSYWNQAARYMSDKTECQKLRSNPELLRPLVDHTLQLGSKLKNPRSLAAMVHALAKILIQTRKNVVDSDKLWKIFEQNIVETSSEKIFNLRICSDILWAFGKRNHDNSDLLFKVMENQVLSNIDELESRTIANTMWAYARAGHSSSTELFDAIAQKAVEKLDNFNSQDIANTVWAYATLGHSSPKLFDAISQKAIKNLDSFNSQALANTIWGYATLGHTSCPKFFDAIAQQTINKLDMFRSQEKASTLWAYATLGHPSSELFDAASHKIVEYADNFNSQALANTVWAYATAEHSSPEVLDAILEKTIEKISTYSSQDISNTMWAYATMGYNIGYVKLDVLISKATTSSMLEKFDVQGIIDLLWSFAVFNYFGNFAAVDLLFSKITMAGLLVDNTNNAEDQKPLSTEALSKLHQVLLWYDEECKRGPLLLPQLREECKLASLSNESRAPMLQQDVSKTLESLVEENSNLVIIHEEKNHCNITGYTLDIVIENTKEEMATVVNIDGPSHFFNNTPNGATILKRRQLRNLVPNRPLIFIPYWEWNELSQQTDKMTDEVKESKQRYLQKCFGDNLRKQYIDH